MGTNYTQLKSKVFNINKMEEMSGFVFQVAQPNEITQSNIMWMWNAALLKT